VTTHKGNCQHAKDPRHAFTSHWFIQKAWVSIYEAKDHLEPKVTFIQSNKSSWFKNYTEWIGGQDSLADKALDYRPKGSGFDPRLHHKRRSLWATDSFSMWDNKDLLIVDEFTYPFFV
jgi:hypothetical protein